MSLKLNGVPVSEKILAGNLHAIILPEENGLPNAATVLSLRNTLLNKCDCARVDILRPYERATLPVNRTVICTDDTYSHIIPLHVRVG